MLVKITFGLKNWGKNNVEQKIMDQKISYRKFVPTSKVEIWAQKMFGQQKKIESKYILSSKNFWSLYITCQKYCMFNKILYMKIFGP